jgi:hypothetical protein
LSTGHLLPTEPAKRNEVIGEKSPLHSVTSGQSVKSPANDSYGRKWQIHRSDVPLSLDDHQVSSRSLCHCRILTFLVVGKIAEVQSSDHTTRIPCSPLY